MFTIPGQYNTAKVFTNVGIEQEAYSQIQTFVNHAAFIGSNISIMPDVHAGKGTVVGFTATLTDKIIPNVIGVDIGCGVLAHPLFMDSKAFLEKAYNLDSFIRSNIPSGLSVREFPFSLREMNDIARMYLVYKFYPWYEEVEKITKDTKQSFEYVTCSLGTLGGGNHFIEVDQAEDGSAWLVVHSGSRNFGLKIANFFQKLAYDSIVKLDVGGEVAKIKATKRGKEIEEAIKQLKKDAVLSVPRDLAYLENDNARRYLHAMNIAQQYAGLNRRIMASEMLSVFGIKFEEAHVIESVHNYIDLTQKIIRKGAIAANKSQQLLIPLTMKAGIIIGKGKGNKDWNYSAPHGAGRRMSRKKAKAELKLADFEQEMKESGVWTTSVSKSTIDEAPQAYKDPQEIIDAIGDAVSIEHVMRPIYNFKNSEE